MVHCAEESGANIRKQQVVKNLALCEWLLENGGPIVRYLTMKELERFSPSAMVGLQNEMLGSPVVRYWMDCLPNSTAFTDIHGSKDDCFENAMGKLTLFGLRKGMRDLDGRCKPLLTWLGNTAGQKRNVLGVFCRSVVASFLAAAGYICINIVRDLVYERIEQIHEFIKKRDYSIYVDKSKFKGIPRSYDNHPLVNPDLYPGGNFALPWIHDVFAFRAMVGSCHDGVVKDKIEDIISYVLDVRYQRLHDGYGVVLTGRRHYNIMGWKVCLPGCGSSASNRFKMGWLIQRLELMSDFRKARSSSWFVESVARLESFGGRAGRYVFPKEYIREKRNSYYVTGGHMGIGENRRRPNAYEIESTWWMMKILNDAGRTAA